MKQLIGHDVGTYSFVASTGKITLSGIPTITLEQILLVTDTTANVVIYQFDTPALGGTYAATVLTLDYNTSALANADTLQIYVDIPSVVSHTILDSGAVTATLVAETTKVLGTTRTADGSGNLLTSTSSALDVNVKTSNLTDPAEVAAGTTASTKVLIVGGKSNDGTPQYRELPEGTGGRSVIVEEWAASSRRTYVVLSAALIAGVTTEALATFTKNVAGTNTTAQTAYTITSGKTFRIQALYVAIINTTTVANNAIYNVRIAASVSASSPIVMSCGAAVDNAVATSKAFFALSLPDGIDIVGNGTLQIGVSHLENVTTASISSFTMVGYEY